MVPNTADAVYHHKIKKESRYFLGSHYLTTTGCVAMGSLKKKHGLTTDCESFKHHQRLLGKQQCIFKVYNRTGHKEHLLLFFWSCDQPKKVEFDQGNGKNVRTKEQLERNLFFP